jgi:hypothetical protein
MTTSIKVLRERARQITLRLKSSNEGRRKEKIRLEEVVDGKTMIIEMLPEMIANSSTEGVTAHILNHLRGKYK